MQFEVIKTNIVNIAVDAIVLPANEALKEGSGTSRAIFEAAGRKNLEKACEKARKELGPHSTGKAIPTHAFDLNAKYIIHAVVPKWVDGNHDEYALLSSAYLSALNIADVLGCESIAFPLLASGNNRFDKKLAVRIAEESIGSFDGTKLKRVFLVVYGDTMEEYIKSLGYEVMIIPENIHWDKKKSEYQAKMDKIIADGKDVAQEILETQLSKAIDWAKDPKNIDTTIQIGKNIITIINRIAQK